MTAREHLERLAAEHGLPAAAPGQLDAILALLAEDPASLSSVREPQDAVRVHVADSLAGLGVAAIREADRLADLGAGAGFPGLVLACALPATWVTLVESVRRKCDFMRRAVAVAGLDNVDVVEARAEEWREGLGTQAAVTARALASLPVLCEYAAPLLRIGGTLAAWKAAPDAAEIADGAAAAAELGLEPAEIVRLPPSEGAEHRTLHLYSKVSSTPNRYPRRAGIARKRPLGASRRT